MELTRRRAADYAPLRVVGIEATPCTARARLRNREDAVDVVTCEVEPEPPHRITATWVTGLVPAGMTPRLPADFADHPMRTRAEGARLVVFSGLPGSGKSTLADAVGQELGVPVFAVDWLLGALTPFGGRHLDGQWEIGAEVLTTLALRQLDLGQSVILDHPVEEEATRERWRSLARRAGAAFRVVVCQCPDEDEHRTRLSGRVRGIPGWHDAGDWDNVRRRLAVFPPWQDGALHVDTTRPHEANVAAVLAHLAG